MHAVSKVRFRDGDTNRPFKGLATREAVSMRYVDKEDDPLEGGSPGDLALHRDMSYRGAGGTAYVRLADGWHRVREVQVVNEELETEVVGWMDGGIARPWVAEPLITVTLTGVDPDPVETRPGEETGTAGGMHAEGQVAERDGAFVCLACGAESADWELFEEAGESCLS